MTLVKDNKKTSKRLIRETNTVTAMVKIYCKNLHHTKKGLCLECQKILDYASYRILKCPFKNDKPSCKVCPVHCFSEPQKSDVKKIMVYSGPRMLLSHPILSLFHFWYELKPVKKNRV